MKKIYLVLSFLIVLSSCKDDVDDLVSSKGSKSTTKVPAKLLSSTRPLPAGDPNLSSTFNWTGQNWTVYFNNANGTIGKVVSLNPFIDGSQKVYGNTNISKADMYPANGWMLVARDFGTPTAANAYPFITLYNKYRGIFRVCILRTTDVLSSYQQITLSYASNSSYPELVKFSPSTDAKIETRNSTYKQTAVTTAGVQEWMIADFDVRGYSQVIPDFSAFVISMSEIAQSDVTLSGTLTLDGTAQPQAGGPTVSGMINNVYNFFTSTAEGASKITKVSPATLQTAITGGADLFLKQILKMVTGFSGGSAGSTYNIKLKGSTFNNGSIKLTSPKTSFAIYLKPVAGANGYKALQTIPWGIFYIGEIPKTFTHNPQYTWVPDGRGDYMEVYTGYYQTVDLAPNFMTNASFKINPAVSNDVLSIECATIEIENPSLERSHENVPIISSFVPLNQFQANNVHLLSDHSNYFGIGIKINFRNGVTVYQVIRLHTI